jgi:hypothetical protein
MNNSVITWAVKHWKGILITLFYACICLNMDIIGAFLFTLTSAMFCGIYKLVSAAPPRYWCDLCNREVGIKNSFGLGALIFCVLSFGIGFLVMLCSQNKCGICNSPVKKLKG